MAWLVALLTVPLMLFIRVLCTKKQESTSIKVPAGLEKIADINTYFYY